MNPSGGGSGVCGGAVADESRILVSIERMNRWVEIEVSERVVMIEAGMNTQKLQEKLKEHGLMLPQNIGSAEWSTIGGNVAVGSGSPFSLKYGVTADWVRNLEVVLPNGETIWTGNLSRKNATGLQLTRLFCGSEGKLGIITKVCLELLPIRENELLFFIQGEEAQLIRLMNEIFLHNLQPLAMEFIDKKGMVLLEKYLFSSFAGEQGEIHFQQAAMWLSFEETYEMAQLHLALSQILYELGIYDLPKMIPSEAQAAAWKVRFAIGRAVIQASIFREIDACVPRKSVQNWLDFLAVHAQKYGYEYTAFGHLGDGNLHINLLKMNLSEQDWENINQNAVIELFQYIISIGGVISGEHGTGQLQKRFLPLQFTETEWKWREKIRKMFDEKGIFE
ncbi:MAG: FAD-binding oxidoreductase [Bacteroidia bacterium]